MIKLENVTKIYNKNKRNEFIALNQINLQIREGEMTAIIGKSGAGKSTLLHILACTDSADRGSYIWNGREIERLSEKEVAKIRNKQIGVVLQDFALIEEFTVFENVILPLHISSEVIKNKKAKVEEALQIVGMEKYKSSKIHELSGGQKQRAAIARAVVNNPDMILADEPTGALDSENADKIMELFHKLHKNGKTIIIVSHDKEISNQCERIIEISDGRIISDSTRNVK